MRKFLFLLAFSSLLFSACEKDTGAAVDPAICKSWQWELSSGGFGGQTIKPATNTIIILTIAANRKFILEKNGVQVQTGSFSVTSFENQPALILDQAVSVEGLHIYHNIQFSLLQDKLQLRDYIADGYSHIFK